MQGRNKQLAAGDYLCAKGQKRTSRPGSPTALNWDITLSNGDRICPSELLLFGARKSRYKFYEERKTVWKATGTYKGEVIEVTGANIDEVVKLWRDAATYRGNDAPGSENK